MTRSSSPRKSKFNPCCCTGVAQTSVNTGLNEADSHKLMLPSKTNHSWKSRNQSAATLHMESVQLPNERNKRESGTQQKRSH